MKISLVVASGVHEGKVIPISTTQFMIGRDPQCQLRPASQAVSKQHCVILIRGEQVFLRDFGSTNGTIVNDEVLRDAEREVNHNDRVKVGPLDFHLRIDATGVQKALGAAPTEAIKKKSDEALAAVQAVVETAAAATVGATPGRKTPAAKPAPAKAPGEPSNDEIAAMLLGLNDDDSAEKVPDGSTVMEAPSVPPPPAPGTPTPSKPAAKVTTREDTSNAASDLLRKMLRRPR